MKRVGFDDLDAAPHAVAFPEVEPRVIKLALDAGERVDSHTHPEREVVLSLRAGDLELDLDDETHELSASDVIRFDGRREVSPTAVTDAEALLVLAARSD
jgi:anti-sigma factor ChrR (cupin superfamily)